jgi:hypothetical protein
VRWPAQEKETKGPALGSQEVCKCARVHGRAMAHACRRRTGAAAHGKVGQRNKKRDRHLRSHEMTPATPARNDFPSLDRWPASPASARRRGGVQGNGGERARLDTRPRLEGWAPQETGETRWSPTVKGGLTVKASEKRGSTRWQLGAAKQRKAAVCTATRSGSSLMDGSGSA